MTTKRLYQDDTYAISIKAAVTGIDGQDGAVCLTFDRTVFFPEGGGQPCDLGEITSTGGEIYDVTKVYDKSLSGDVFHIVDAPLNAFNVGDVVTLEIDWDRRFGNMQRHSGEHILSGAFYKVCGGTNKGFHMGEEYITIDIDMDGALLTQDQIDEAERLANTAIWDDLLISRLCFSDAAEASRMPVRKAIDIEGEISVIVVGDPTDPFDCVACCGTHLSSAGQIGLIKVYKAEPNKGMTRVYFDCGIMAFERCRDEMRTLYEISNRYSTKASGIIHALDAERDKVAALREHVAALSAYYKMKTVQEIKAVIDEDPSPKMVISHTSEIATTDELLKTGFDIVNSLGKSSDDRAILLIMIQPVEKTVLLISHGDINCGKLVKENAKSFGGRGGGRPDNARALFSNTSDLNDFVALIKRTVENE